MLGIKQHTHAILDGGEGCGQQLALGVESVLREANGTVEAVIHCSDQGAGKANNAREHSHGGLQTLSNQSHEHVPLKRFNVAATQGRAELRKHVDGWEAARLAAIGQWPDRVEAQLDAEGLRRAILHLAETNAREFVT